VGLISLKSLILTNVYPNNKKNNNKKKNNKVKSKPLELRSRVKTLLGSYRGTFKDKEALLLGGTRHFLDIKSYWASVQSRAKCCIQRRSLTFSPLEVFFGKYSDWRRQPWKNRADQDYHT
jgi:hypothetical protein